MMRLFRTLALLAIFVMQHGCYPAEYAVFQQGPFSQLEARFSVYLDATWTPERAAALLETLEAVAPNLELRFSKWQISDDPIENGIEIETAGAVTLVTISGTCFAGGEQEQKPGMEREGAFGTSLYAAVVQFVTDGGTDRSVIEMILRERYGITVPPPAVSTEEATPGTAEKRYSAFENRDLMVILSVFEMFPAVFHQLPQLTYIVRRVDTEGTGRSTAVIGGERIEFADTIFSRPYSYETRRVIAHEKTHFLWAYVFTPQLKADWTALSGWYRDAGSESGWSTTEDPSAFVSDYAYQVNPNEDMAESVAYYLVHPERLRSRCPEKYEFIRDRIMFMEGERYRGLPL